MSKSLEHAGALTRHRPGSVRELATITIPLMLTMASGCIMWFVDRIFLGRFSAHSLNAVISCATALWMFQFAIISIAAIAEVFVGQYNGARDYKRIGEPVWQMIYLSLFSLVLFVPLALWSGEFFVPERYHDDGLPFFKIVMLLAFFFPMTTAVASFFVGLGKTRLVMWISIIANLVNIGLDCVLIFGVEGLLEPMGATGAAIATSFAVAIQSLILFGIFLSKHNRATYGTGDMRFKGSQFWHCVKVGFPKAAGHFIELSAWALIVRMVAEKSEDHITIMAISQTWYILFAFLTEGLQQGVIAVSSNYIGAKRFEVIHNVLRSAIRLCAIIFAFMTLTMAFLPANMINDLFSGKLPEHLYSMGEVVLCTTCIALFLDALGWASAGILVGAGDTKSVMLINAVNAWIFGLVPVYIALYHFNGGPLASPTLMLGYLSFNAAAMYLRYRNGKWRLMHL